VKHEIMYKHFRTSFNFDEYTQLNLELDLLSCSEFYYPWLQFLFWDDKDDGQILCAL